MSVYRRKGSPYYWYEFEIKKQRFRASTGCTSRRAAEAAEKEARKLAKHQVCTNIVFDAAQPTVDEVFARYFRAHGSQLDWASEVGYHMEGALRTFGPDTPYHEITNKQVAEALDAYAATGVSNSTVNLRLAVLRGIWYKARDEWEIKVGTVNWGKHKREGSGPRIRHITLDTAKKVLQRLPKHIQLMYAWSLATGCRLSETENLRWDRINFETLQAEVMTKSARKHATRFINLNAEALAVLAECERSGEYVFDATNRRKHWEKARAEVGLEDFRWHDLRHTFATWLGQSGAALHVIQQALGHSRVETTMKYLHVIRTDVQKAVERLPSVTDAEIKSLIANERQ